MRGISPNPDIDPDISVGRASGPGRIHLDPTRILSFRDRSGRRVPDDGRHRLWIAAGNIDGKADWLAITSLLLSSLSFVGLLLFIRYVGRLEQRIAWLEGQGQEERGEQESDIPEMMKEGATQPPGSA